MDILKKEVGKMGLRKAIGKITSPIFVPLRKIVAWGDQNFGTCDSTLVVVSRDSEFVPEDSNVMRSVGNFVLSRRMLSFYYFSTFHYGCIIFSGFQSRARSRPVAFISECFFECYACFNVLPHLHYHES